MRVQRDAALLVAGVPVVEELFVEDDAHAVAERSGPRGGAVRVQNVVDAAGCSP